MKKIVKPIIVGNLKATPESLKEVTSLIKSVDKKIANSGNKKINYLLAVPEVYINPVSLITKTGIIGAQNISGITEGQQTGETTTNMLQSSGAEFAILGHSEVRKRGEGNERIAEKLKISLSQRLTTILCVGEKERDKDGKYLSFLEEEIKSCLAFIKRESLNNLIIAYEPIWAIGGSAPATPQECFEVVISIRRTLAEMFGIDHAKKVHMLYGGTVTEENATTFIEEGGVDGLLIGRASQTPTSFSSIILHCYK